MRRMIGLDWIGLVECLFENKGMERDGDDLIGVIR